MKWSGLRIRLGVAWMKQNEPQGRIIFETAAGASGETWGALARSVNNSKQGQGFSGIREALGGGESDAELTEEAVQVCGQLIEVLAGIAGLVGGLHNLLRQPGGFGDIAVDVVDHVRLLQGGAGD